MKKISLCLLTLGIVVVAFSQQPAFPGAEGAGKFTLGGRGTSSAVSKVFAVTTLADDANGSTIGSLRWALTQTATYRTIIFRVSGTIRLVAPLKITKPYTTIAGQTAPGGGICIADHPVSISADNVIIRYLRFRMGDRYQNKGKVDGSGSDDALGGINRNNIVVDHCTMSWSTDEACSIYDGNNITLQWNIMSEPLNYSYHFETGDTDFEKHAYGGIWGGNPATFHHNLFAHCKGRNPRFTGSRFLADGSTAGLENCDFRNNVIYNWESYSTNGGEGGNYNIVNNYYKRGPNTSSSNSSGVPIRGMIMNPSVSTTLPYPQIYLSGNYVDGYTNITANNWLGIAMSGGALKDTGLSKVSVPFALAAVPTESALDAFQSVLKNAGCVLPYRDTLDQRIINNVIDRTGKIIDVQGGYPHGTAFDQTINAWPTLPVGTPAVTTNANNIPDEWLAQRGLTGKAISGTGGYHANGYTHLENFLNGDSIVAFGTPLYCVNAKTVSSNNTNKWIDIKDTSYVRLVSTDTNNIVTALYDNISLGRVDVSYFTTNVTRRDINNRPYLNRNITIVPQNSFTGEAKIRIYFTKAEFDSLKNADASISSLSDLVILKRSSNTCVSSLPGDPEVITPTGSGVYGTYQNGYYLECTTNSFGTFYIAGKSLFTVPVRLIDLNAYVTNKKSIHIQWQVQHELNILQYTLQKSTDAIDFVEVKGVKATNALLYSLEDNEYSSNVVYYRIQIKEVSGNTYYSKIVPVILKDVKEYKILNNPVNNFVNIALPQNASETVFKVIASDGRAIKTIKVRKGTTNMTIYISDIPVGVYYLKCTSNIGTQTLQLIKN